MRMVVLHYIPSIDRDSGGVGVYMQLLSKELGKRVDLHILTHRSANQLELENCTLHYIGMEWMPWSATKREFVSLLDELHPDVFHTNCCWLPLSALTSIWAKNLGYKVIYTPHGMLEPWIMSRHYWTKKVPATLLFQRKGVASADLLHATAESEKANLLNLGWNGKIHVVPNCVDLDDIDANVGSLKCSQCGTKNKSILFLSRVHVKKGINFLIEAVAQLKEELKGWNVKIAGEGDADYVNQMVMYAKEKGVDDIVKFVGGVYGKEKWKLYKEASLFVLPTHSENFGIVVAEALACEVPVITTTGTPWEELKDYNCGWWIAIGAQPMVRALREFLNKSDEELCDMGRNGRRLVEERYSCSIVAEQFVEMYNKVK